MAKDKVIVFFDGKCPFCVGWVKFLIDRDGEDRFRFAALQSQWTDQFFQSKGVRHPGMGSIVVWDEEFMLRQSDAISRLAHYLPGVWKAFGMARHLPRRIRDSLYNFIGRHRYRFFGRYDSCWLPTSEDKRKFLDLEDPIYESSGNGKSTKDD